VFFVVKNSWMWGGISLDKYICGFIFITNEKENI